MPVRYDVKQSVSFSSDMAHEIKAVAERFNWTFSEVVRQCCENDLPKLIDRESARRRRAKARS